MSCLEKRDNRSKMESPVPSLHHQTQTIPNLTSTSTSPRKVILNVTLEFPGEH